jgi:hypothetical protein
MTMGGIDWRQIGLVRRSDQIDTRRMLLVAEAAEYLAEFYTLEQLAELFVVPVQGGVSAEARLREALSVVAFWRPRMLAEAARLGAPWHALVEPARWDDVAVADAQAFVDNHIARWQRWPSVGSTRRRFGRVTNHRPAGDTEGQGALAIDEAPAHG